MRPWGRHSPEAASAILTICLTVATLTAQLIVSALSAPALELGPGRKIGVVTLGLLTSCTFLALVRQIVERRAKRSTILTALVVILALAALPLSGWSLVGLAMAAAMLYFPIPYGFLAAAAVGASAVVLVEHTTDNPVDQAVIPIVGLLVGIIIYSLTRLIVVLKELEVAREHLARLEVDEERFRISRDLHDIMGRALVTASLRNQTALRLIDRDPGSATEQLLLAEETLASSQAQLRSITSGPVTTSLEDELESARRLFTRLEIRCSIEENCSLHGETSKTAARVVREAVTNMLKHSRPKSCWIVLRQDSMETVLSIVNDGDLAPQERRQTNGTGLNDLAQRVARLGGTLEAKRLSGHRFSVVTRFPNTDTTTATPTTRAETPDAPPHR